MAGEDSRPHVKSPLRIAKAVFWSFFGIRKTVALEDDAAHITPAQAIIGGIVGAALFVAILIAVVIAVTR